MNIKKSQVKRIARWLFWGILGGVLFAFLDRAGYLLYNYGTLWHVSENPLHKIIFHRILCRLPFYTGVMMFLIAVIPYIVKLVARAPKIQYRKYLFWIFWAILFIGWIPAFFGCFPGIFAADAPNQIGWYNQGAFNAHHPVLHTLLLVNFWKIGKYFCASETIGIAIYSIFQMAVLSACYAKVLVWMTRKKVSVVLFAFTGIFFVFHPMHAIQSVYATKDVLFAGFFTVYLTKVIDLFETPERIKQWKFFVQLVIWLFLCLAFRNNMLYAFLVFTPVVICALGSYWRRGVLLILVSLVCYFMFTGPGYQLMDVEPGNAREAYSVIIQTLARTYVSSPGRFTEEELEVITPVLSEEAMSCYTSTISDPVKCMFNTEAFNENKGEFLRTWLKVGMRNKKIYIDAFLLTTYGFWSMEVEENFKLQCIDIEQGDENYPHITMEPISENLYAYYAKVCNTQELPGGIRFLFQSAFYVWLMLFAIIYICYRKQYKLILLILLPGLYFMTFLLGPCSGFRYFYAIFSITPLVLWVILEKTDFRRSL